jgi:hypothetical protein
LPENKDFTKWHGGESQVIAAQNRVKNGTQYGKSIAEESNKAIRG